MNRPTVSQADIQKHIEFTNESGELLPYSQACRENKEPIADIIGGDGA